LNSVSISISKRSGYHAFNTTV